VTDAQQYLLPWQEIEAAPELLRLERTLAHFDDAPLLAALAAERRGHRNDYPNSIMFACFVAALLLGHETTAALLRELARNPSLRCACGFDPGQRVPTAFAFSRFLDRLTRHQDILEEMFQKLVAKIAKALPDLGVRLAADGKAITAASKADHEASLGFKKDSESGATMKHWYGFKLHLLADAVYELPLAFELTTASEHESPHLIPLVKKYHEEQPECAARAESLAADRGYDDGADKATLFDQFGIDPIIPARRLGTEPTPLDEKKHDTIYTLPDGNVVCKVNPLETGEKRYCAMQFQGFEADRGTLKFRCPAAAYGFECKNKEACQSKTKDQGFGRVVRVAVAEDPRRRLPTHQHGLAFRKRYKQRTSIERLFARLDHLYGFERHTARGMGKVKARVTIGLSAMLATALAWIDVGKVENIRRLRVA
jgi:hypothetical protein